jgi:Na+-transporting methylmalonyl-CoA/oxaloacetate decarboxylase gamma subunit
MDNTLFTSVIVSGIAMSVIFLVLTVLIFSIRLLVHFIPYVEPKKPTPKVQPTPTTSTAADTDEDVAVITSVMTSHLSQLPGNSQIINIQSR